MDGGKRSTTTFDVYVAGIPGDLDEDDISKIFAECGNIEGVQFLNNKPGYDTRVAFVKYSSEDDSIAAQRLLNNYDVGSSKLKVRYQRKTKPDNSPSSHQSSSHSDNKPAGGFPSQPSTGYQNKGNRNFPERPTNTIQQANAKPVGRPERTGVSSNGFDEPVSPVARMKKIIVTSVESGTSFWAQDNEPESLLLMSMISEKLEVVGPQLSCSEADLLSSSTKVFGSIFHIDGMWYRCDILRDFKVNMPPGKVAVRYIDYGNVEIVGRNSLVCLPRDLSAIPPQAKPYCLHGVQLARSSNQETAEADALVALTGFIMEQLGEATIHQEGTPAYCDLHVQAEGGKSFNVTAKLMETGFLEKKKSTPVKTEARAAEEGRRPKPEFTDKHPTDGKLVNDMKKEISSLKQSMQSAIEQRNALTSQSLTAKTKHDNQLRVHVNESLLSAMAEMNELKVSRSSPSMAPTIPAYISEAMRLVTDETSSLVLEQFQPYIKVVQAKEVLSSCQEAIRGWSQDKEPLVEFTERREQARIAYVEEAQKFLATVKTIPIDERTAQLKQSKFSLEKKHVKEMLATGSDALPVAEALNALQAWKTCIDKKLEACRADVNGASKALTQSLCAAMQFLDFETEAGELDRSQPLIDDQIRTLSEKIRFEVEQTKANGANEQGEVHVMHLVRAIDKAITSELNDIERFRAIILPGLLEDETAVSEWLSRKPELANLWSIRKLVKEQRSVFRHRQADRRDAEEEGDDDNTEELEKIEADINVLRKQMHSLFVKEADEMRLIANISQCHFPELSIQHAALNLAEYWRTNGIILSSRELEHYSHSPLLVVACVDRHTRLLTSVFDDKPCLLKEYIIDSQLSVDTIQSRVTEYSLGCVGPNFVPCDALFYDKVTRHLYLQTPSYDAGTLLSFIKTGPSFKVLQSLLQQLLHAIVVMQSNNFHHGEVTPVNVFIGKSDNGGYSLHIGQPQFADALSVRMSRTADFFDQSPYPALPSAPQTDTVLFDVRCYACIALWCFFPDEYFSKDVAGSLALIQEDRVALKDLIESILALSTSPSSVLVEQHVFFEKEDDSVCNHLQNDAPAQDADNMAPEQPTPSGQIECDAMPHAEIRDQSEDREATPEDSEQTDGDQIPGAVVLESKEETVDSTEILVEHHAVENQEEIGQTDEKVN